MSESEPLKSVIPESAWREQSKGWLGDRVICVEGLRLFQTVAPA